MHKTLLNDDKWQSAVTTAWVVMATPDMHLAMHKRRTINAWACKPASCEYLTHMGEVQQVLGTLRICHNLIMPIDHVASICAGHAEKRVQTGS